MSQAAEFFLIALAIYLLDSLLWPALRGVVLWRWPGGWRILRPDRWLALRETGLVPLPPFWSMISLAPCQAPPLVVDQEGRWAIETSDGRFVSVSPSNWDDLATDHRHLVVGGIRTKLQSPRGLERLRRARMRHLDLARAVVADWRWALSPTRARREWRKWKRVSGPLLWLQVLLTWGFFVGLPMTYLYLGPVRTIWFGLWLWGLMLMIAGYIWWLARRVYPGVRGELRMEAALSLIVPFHAMRAAELAAVHAFGNTHPLALLAALGGKRPAWCGEFVRRVLFPRPGIEGDVVFSSALSAPLASVVAQAGWSVDDFIVPPTDVITDSGAVAYCPRCHGMFTTGVSTCIACHGLALRSVTAPRIS